MNEKEIYKYIEKMNFEEKNNFIETAIGLIIQEKDELEKQTKKLKKELEILDKENISELKSERDYYKLRFTELNKNFQKIIDELLGKNYYNMGCDWYNCDILTVEDLLYKYKRKWWQIWK